MTARTLAAMIALAGAVAGCEQAGSIGDAASIGDAVTMRAAPAAAQQLCIARVNEAIGVPGATVLRSEQRESGSLVRLQDGVGNGIWVCTVGVDGLVDRLSFGGN